MVLENFLLENFFANILSKSSKIRERWDCNRTDHTKIVETFNTFFSDVIKALNIEKNERITCNAGQKSSILQVIKECSIDLTIVRIKN